MGKKLITKIVILVKQEVMILMIANSRNIPNIKKVKSEIIIIWKLVYFFYIIINLNELYALLILL